MYVAIINIKPRLVKRDPPATPVIAANCSRCRQVKSHRGGMECNHDQTLKFVCRECLAAIDEVDRQAEEYLGGIA